MANGQVVSDISQEYSWLKTVNLECTEAIPNDLLLRVMTSLPVQYKSSEVVKVT